MKRLETGTILYHGSYCAVKRPNLDKCARFKDFEKDFNSSKANPSHWGNL